MNKAPIGVFDTGVGGLTILRELRLRLPGEDFLYAADQAHAPYGSRPMEEVRRLGFGIASFLLARGAKLIVVACNTISAAALQPLRAAHPEVPFVGMEPAVKPAARESHSGVIGVVATEATFHGELFASAVDRYGKGVHVIPQTLPGLVERIEAGETEGPELETYLRVRLQPLLDEGIDELVLGCTHYPLVEGALRKVLGPRVTIVDPSPAIARQTEQLLAEGGLRGGGAGSVCAFTSGDPDSLRRFIRLALGEDFPVQRVKWADDDRLMEQNLE
ncbi:MAG: glutamate racemase [Anaerolineales bacterium]|nr:glutamate racemase [Anaerolineales bacterium]